MCGLLMKDDEFRLLSLFGSRVRVEILRLLLELEFRSLSEIAQKLEARGLKMTLSGVLKHMRELEKAGLIRHEPGIFTDKPDARKTIYSLEGRERIEKILWLLENEVIPALKAGMIFSETVTLARQIQGNRHKPFEKERLQTLLDGFSSESTSRHLTTDEKKKIELWKMMLSVM